MMTGEPHRQETVPASGRRTPPRRRRCLPRQAATIPASHPPDCPTGPPAATASVLGLPGRQRPGSAAAGLRAGDRAARWHVHRRRWRSFRVRSWTRTPRSQSARRAGNGHARLPIDDQLVTRRDDVTRESRIEGRRIRRSGAVRVSWCFLFAPHRTGIMRRRARITGMMPPRERVRWRGWRSVI